MKMRKWLPLVLAAGFATLSLAGCGGSEQENLSEVENNPQFNYRLGYDVTALGEPDENIVVDGVLDDEVWQDKAFYSSGFNEDTTGDQYAHYRMTAFPTEKGVWIGAEAKDTNIRRYNDYGSFAPERNTGWELYFFCLPHGADQNKTQPVSIRQCFHVDVNGNVLSTTSMSALAAVHLDGEPNSGETVGASFEMFIPYSALRIDTTEGTPEYFNILPIYRAFLPGTTTISRTNLWPFPWIYTPAFYRFDADGYTSEDAPDATVGDAPSGFAKSANWDVSRESEKIVESKGAMWQFIFFRDLYADKFIMKATVELKGTLASCDIEPRAGLMVMDSLQNYYSFMLDHRNLKNGKIENALTFTTRTYRVSGTSPDPNKSEVSPIPISAPMQKVKLALVKNGATLSYYVNGQKAFETTQNDFMYNVYAGFYVDKANAVFSDYAASAYSSEVELLQLANEYGITIQ